ncbi:cell wall-active antibiotics response protein [Lacihabitans sp. CS3-21]|jgi:hypothetical protein|uniref:cell wall-active antibiotics response protein n=1 Tax=Lacihabitans sp. CS3-21 TaxID=2487332 RepID=UPI000BDC1463|nr:cell wall-active antibiotics response protein [Lacihabitans sp. CS3-21]MCP9747286.1 hypothetical protein [Lacihabitans sp. CS3-21]MDP1815622.1 cell wall-active antibiotics response protein [Leadbetterella sp.]OYU67284.1 MAG: hypothetical protein CFE22_05280 [Cytophagaceae bacterium BCCC1]
MNNNNKNAVFFWSILLVSIGGLFLFRNFGMLNFNFPVKIFSWRLVPLIIGINAFLKGKNMEGIIATTIAVVFFIPDFLTSAERQTYYKLWPLLLVGLGGLILYKYFNPKFDMPKRQLKADGTDFEYLNESNIMAGTNKKVFSKNFEGGQVNCVMGGAQIDLTEADLAAKSGLNIFILMGGLELRVPKEWNVMIDVLPIMGGVEDQITKFPESVVNKEKKFYLSGNVVMGGVEIKRY